MRGSREFMGSKNNGTDRRDVTYYLEKMERSRRRVRMRSTA